MLLLNKIAHPAKWVKQKWFVRHSHRRYSIASCGAINVPFARNVLQWHPSLPRRGPGFQLRKLIRVFSTERLGMQLTKRYSGLGETSSVMGTTVNWRFLQSPRDASILSPEQIFSTQYTHLVFLLSSLLFNTDSSSERRKRR